MKKIITASLSLVLICAFLLSATSCALGDPFKKFSKKIEKEENYALSYSLTHKEAGTFKMFAYVDGNIMYLPENEGLGIAETYFETNGDTTVEYVKHANGKWTKNESTTDAYSFMQDDILNPDKFKEVEDEKGVYKQKESVVFENFEDVIITFEDDSAIIKATM